MKNYFKKIYLNYCINSSGDSIKKRKLKFFFHSIFNKKGTGSLGFDFTDKPLRMEIVQKIINAKNYKNYLEIGCRNNELFDKVECNEKVGVDPVCGGTIKDYSDNFFKYNKKNFDIVFIDGLHMYHQVKNDIINSLKFLNDNGIILLHDCLPNTVYDQAVPRCKMNWNGDVWKAIVEMRTKEDVDTYTCYADQGIGVIFKRPNKNKLDLNINDFSKLRFKDYFDNNKSYMNIISYEELKNLV